MYRLVLRVACIKFAEKFLFEAQSLTHAKLY